MNVGSCRAYPPGHLAGPVWTNEEGVDNRFDHRAPGALALRGSTAGNGRMVGAPASGEETGTDTLTMACAGGTA